MYRERFYFLSPLPPPLFFLITVTHTQLYSAVIYKMYIAVVHVYSVMEQVELYALIFCTRDCAVIVPVLFVHPCAVLCWVCTYPCAVCKLIDTISMVTQYLLTCQCSHLCNNFFSSCLEYMPICAAVVIKIHIGRVLFIDPLYMVHIFWRLGGGGSLEVLFVSQPHPLLPLPVALESLGQHVV